MRLCHEVNIPAPFARCWVGLLPLWGFGALDEIVPRGIVIVQQPLREGIGERTRVEGRESTGLG